VDLRSTELRRPEPRSRSDPWSRWTEHMLHPMGHESVTKNGGPASSLRMAEMMGNARSDPTDSSLVSGG
jgi:hypothetical protein